LNLQCFVHRGEVDDGVGRDVVLVQCPPEEKYGFFIITLLKLFKVFAYTVEGA